MLRSSLVLVLAVLALSGCGAVEASTPRASAATPSLPCFLPYGTHVALLSPVPGSFGVAAGSAAVVVVASRDLPKTIAIVATEAKGVASSAATLERTSRPVHAARPPFSDPVYYRASGLALHAHRHYTLALDDVAQNGCAPYAKITGNARFST
jgi:hypothetical protein